jgi:phage tail sheath protein FI
MPQSLTYPGVYIEEVPSGVRTIVGVSTSVTAFAGGAKRGLINAATRIFNFSDYERLFGGLDKDSEMSYAVRQFYLNGGGEAWIIRIAKNASGAGIELEDGQTPARKVLELTAKAPGLAGNDIEVRVDHKADNPASNFNLTVNYRSSDNPNDSVSERFENLSMNSGSGRYAVSVIKEGSELITAARTATADAALAALPAATSLSGLLEDPPGTLQDVDLLVDATHNQFRVAVNDLPPVTVTLTPPFGGAAPVNRLATLCGAIQAAVIAEAGGRPPLTGFTCVRQGNQILTASGQGGEASQIRVLPGERNDVSGRLKLGALGGGVETDGVAAIRLRQVPNPGTLTSGVFAAADLQTLPDAMHDSFDLSLDNGPAVTVTLSPNTAAVGATLQLKLQDVAARIQTAVRALRPSSESFRDFTATPTNDRLVLASGTPGKGSSVAVQASPATSMAAELHLIGGAQVPGTNQNLGGGAESPLTGVVYNEFIGSRNKREGIFALEAVDLFNLLCLPGETDPGILADAAAYCLERRAFLIVDSPRTSDKPDEMVAKAMGPDLPRTRNGAVYYPWIVVADPLKNGRPRTSAPSGTIAGLYARTDASRGIWKAPAGTDANLSGVRNLEYTLTDLQNGTLNPLGVNCLRVFPVFGATAWGARTLVGADAQANEWKYIPIRRLALYIEESLFRGTKWVVFEPNDEPLWAQIRLNVGAFMHDLFRQGAFQGQTPREAYFVKCDKETTTQSDRNRGVVNILVGFAPLKPAEFVVLKLQQIAGEIQT